jgi:hypothetical protein
MHDVLLTLALGGTVMMAMFAAAIASKYEALGRFGTSADACEVSESDYL